MPPFITSNGTTPQVLLVLFTKEVWECKRNLGKAGIVFNRDMKPTYFILSFKKIKIATLILNPKTVSFYLL